MHPHFQGAHLILIFSTVYYRTISAAARFSMYLRVVRPGLALKALMIKENDIIQHIF